MGSCHSAPSASRSLQKKLKLKKSNIPTPLGPKPTPQSPQPSPIHFNPDDNLPFIDQNQLNQSEDECEISLINETKLESNTSAMSQEINNNINPSIKPRSIPVLSTLSTNSNSNSNAKPSLSRLVYKPPASHIVTSASSIITTCSSKPTSLIKSQSASPPLSPKPDTICLVASHVRHEQYENNNSTQLLKQSIPSILQNQKNPVLNINNNNSTRRNLSPFRSFLKPPSALANTTSQSQKNQLQNKSETSMQKNNFTNLNLNNQSTSVSSLSSASTSSCQSNTLVASKLTKIKKPVYKSPNNNKSNILPSPVQPRKSPNLVMQQAKPVMQPVSQKKRLFSPYKFNLNKQAPEDKSLIKEQPKQEEVEKPLIEINTNPVPALSSASSSKLKFSFTKMPMPAKSNLKTINKLNQNSVKSGSNPDETPLKRDDSAYSSSTSSTVSSSSSNDADLNSQFKDVEPAEAPVVDSNEDETKSINIQEEQDNVEGLDQVIKSVALKQQTRANTSIRDSIGELNHLMLMSSSGQQAEMFKPPSNLPPIENGEVIQIDIESYRLLLQDLQSCKLVLHKLASVLREPSCLSNGNDCASELQQDDLQSMVFSNPNNPLLTSFYEHNSSAGFDLGLSVEKVDQSTQTDL